MKAWCCILNDTNKTDVKEEEEDAIDRAGNRREFVIRSIPVTTIARIPNLSEGREIEFNPFSRNSRHDVTDIGRPLQPPWILRIREARGPHDGPRSNGERCFSRAGDEFATSMDELSAGIGRGKASGREGTRNSAWSRVSLCLQTSGFPLPRLHGSPPPLPSGTSLFWSPASSQYSPFLFVRFSFLSVHPRLPVERKRTAGLTVPLLPTRPPPSRPLRFKSPSGDGGVSGGREDVNSTWHGNAGDAQPRNEARIGETRSKISKRDSKSHFSFILFRRSILRSLFLY